MDKQYPPDAWKRLGKALEARRGELGYGFRQRGKFLDDRGGAPPSVKTLARLERGERTAYPDATVTRLESLYAITPGSFEAFLASGKPLQAIPRPAPLRPVLPPPRAADGSQDSQRFLDELLRGYPDDEIVQALGNRRGPPPRVRVAEILEWLEVKARHEGRLENGTSAG